MQACSATVKGRCGNQASASRLVNDAIISHDKSRVCPVPSVTDYYQLPVITTRVDDVPMS